MTVNRRDGLDATEFSKWLREQKEIDSKDGYLATNIDYLWTNWKTNGEWMMIEEKRHCSEPKSWQVKMFETLDSACKKGDIKYRGFYILTFENTSPNDGLIWLHGNQITKEELIKFLRFEITLPDIIVISKDRKGLPEFKK